MVEIAILPDSSLKLGDGVVDSLGKLLNYDYPPLFPMWKLEYIKYMCSDILPLPVALNNLMILKFRPYVCQFGIF